VKRLCLWQLINWQDKLNSHTSVDQGDIIMSVWETNSAAFKVKILATALEVFGLVAILRAGYPAESILIPLMVVLLCQGAIWIHPENRVLRWIASAGLVIALPFFPIFRYMTPSDENIGLVIATLCLTALAIWFGIKARPKCETKDNREVEAGIPDGREQSTPSLPAQPHEANQAAIPPPYRGLGRKQTLGAFTVGIAMIAACLFPPMQARKYEWQTDWQFDGFGVMLDLPHGPAHRLYSAMLISELLLLAIIAAALVWILKGSKSQ
jgi:hypothetical protein